MAKGPSTDVYWLHVWIRQISPMIWRRLLVHSDSTIADLHHTLQIAFGWSDGHLNLSHVHGQNYGVYHDGGMSFSTDPRQIRLCDFKFRINECFLYEHDFGDGWQHEVRLEDRLALKEKRTYPCCIGGQRRAPPENCGGHSPSWRDVMKSRCKLRICSKKSVSVLQPTTCRPFAIVLKTSRICANG